MTHAPLDRMRGAQQGLIAALDSSDIAALEAAVASYRLCIEDVRSAGAAALGSEGPSRTTELQRLSDEAQARVNFLTDALQRRLARLTEAGGRGRVPLYAREGR